MPLTADPDRDDWNRHWDAYEQVSRLNPAQDFRYRLLTDALALERATHPVRVLDVGSGQGEYARKLLARFPRIEYLGIDFSRSGVEHGRRQVPAARFYEGDVQHPLALPDAYRGWATHAACSEVLEHLDDPAAALRNVLPWLSPGGRLVVTVPGGPMSAFDRHIGHRRHYTPSRLAGLLTDAGFDRVTVRGAGFPFFNLYRLAVVLQGDGLVERASKPEFDSKLLSRVGARVFGGLFQLTTSRTRLGWQLVAEGSRPFGGGAR